MTEQQIVANAPEDWTHYADDTYLQFAGVWLRYESGCPEITCCKEWVADIDINDCENIRSRSDIERIVELEDEVQCYESVHENMVNKDSKWLQRFALEQQAKGVMRVMACKEMNLSEGDIDTLILIKEQLRNQAKELGK